MAQREMFSQPDDGWQDAASSEQSRTIDAVEVPQQPLLAPNIQLVGAMEGVGFDDKQWLIERDGRFLQVSELLYRIAERCDGHRTLSDIAAEVTAATDWLVSAGDVQFIVKSKLMPLGLIVSAEGFGNAEAPHASPLRVNMRRRIISPQILDPICGSLQILYAPPVLFLLLVLTAIAHWWLYFKHGLATGLDAVIYAPALLLLIFPIAVVGGVFHELGHAVALRYGGGRARGMGVGFYLIYPTFYTDSTDAYRLSRWARVRTDLGGIYFHLIFALGVIVTYLISGHEFLLLVVMLVSLETVFQLLPIARLDGYWALADLTGIPDFFSLIGPFLLTMLPVRGARVTKLPSLRRWVKVVFAAYILLAVPVLVFLLALIVMFAPQRLGSVWDSFLKHMTEFSNATATGDVLASMLSLLQMLVLALLLLGTAYLLWRIGWKSALVIWSWSQPTLARRLLGTVGGALMVTALALVWAPQWPPVRTSTVGGPPDTQNFELAERSHVPPPVIYAVIPPVGGSHSAIWQNCGFYDAPILNEAAVHSLEHGAVWITYRPDLSREQVESLADVARGQTHLLASPFPDLPAPVVVSAWGRQLQLDSATDPRLDQFIRDFRLGRQAPESGGLCTGGVGHPT
jgi:putative peptide zinc metalloprotease protein